MERTDVDKLKVPVGTIINANGVSYVAGRVIGHGSFGVVFQASKVGTGEIVAIKKVLQDKRFKNRELQVVRMLNHPNVIRLENSFFTNVENAVYLNLVLDYVPETLFQFCRYYVKSKKRMPLLYCKLYAYQLSRALGYLHELGICHRDIKPQNLLLDNNEGTLKLCDFGSAKSLVPGEPSTAYICSRYYRAPELIFGSPLYTKSIDIWSMGCVFAEMILMEPLFPGESGVDQLVEIIKVLGTPSKEQVETMNKDFTMHGFPRIQPYPWRNVFPQDVPKEAIDLISKIIVYEPESRLRPFEVCAHPFFDELRNPSTKLPNGKPIPSELFSFTKEELGAAYETLYPKLVPPHIEVQRKPLPL